MTEIAFWDTSAIIPLHCNQLMSPELRRLGRRYQSLIVWWGTHVEIYSGLARLFREGALTDSQRRKAITK